MGLVELLSKCIWSGVVLWLFHVYKSELSGLIKNNSLIDKKGEYYNLTPQGRDFLKFFEFEKLPKRFL